MDIYKPWPFFFKSEENSAKKALFEKKNYSLLFRKYVIRLFLVRSMMLHCICVQLCLEIFHLQPSYYFDLSKASR